MRVCITGGLGYLGSRLTETLANRGHSVSLIDSNLYGNFLSSDIKHKTRVANSSVLSPSEESIRLIKDADVIVHLAAIVGDQACDLVKSDAVDINLNGTKTIAKLCGSFHKKMIYASTCSVYGASDNTLTEKSKVLPLSIYGLVKYAGERVLDESEADYVILRMGTLFGFSRRMRFDLVVNTFVARALEGKEISVFGGEQFRPLLHLEDACDCFAAVIEGDSFGRRTYNVGGLNTRISEVAYEVQRTMGARVRVMAELKDPRNYRVDSTSVQDAFKLHFRRSLEFGIEETRDRVRSSGMKDLDAPIYSNVDHIRNVITSGGRLV